MLLEPRFGIAINNKEVGEEMLKYVTQVNVLEEDDTLPQATITIDDLEGMWMNDKAIVDGTGIRIGMGHRKNYKRIFTGFVTYIEADFPETGYPSLQLVCTDLAKKLMIVRKPRTFKKKKLSDVIKQMHQEAGVKIIVDDTKVVHPFITQEEESNLDFIIKHKKKMGWKYYKVDVDTYYFGAKIRNPKAKETLSYNTGGHEIISFKPVLIGIEEEEDIEYKEVDNKTGKVVSTKSKVTKTSNAGATPVGKATVKSK